MSAFVSSDPGDATDVVDVVDVVDDLSRHLPHAREFDRAALIPGMYLCWCARLDLLEQGFAEQHAEQLLQLRYRDGSCVDLFVTGCDGTLRFSHLNERGARFTREYYSRYIELWRDTFVSDASLSDSSSSDIYGVSDSWETYEKIAGPLTQALLGPPNTQKASIAIPRSWWRFWQR